MPLEPRDAAYLWDIVETGRTIAEFTAGVVVHSYLSDRKLQMAIERAVEIIERAARVRGGQRPDEMARSSTARAGDTIRIWNQLSSGES
jgi:hypothetical protein